MVKRNEILQPRSLDAIMVIPGIMGSELRDQVTGKTIWGLRDPRWYVDAWTFGRSLAALSMTDDELAGHYGRVSATRLLTFPAFAPLLRGIEPYTALVKALRGVAVHPDAVSAFPYDWRLPVAYSSRLLAESSIEHLERWRAHPDQIAAMRLDPAQQGPRLIFVAHSMGGLLAEQAARMPEMQGLIRRIITLGTPFFGAVKAAVMLSTGSGTPIHLPKGRLRALAVRLPGLYDLLPSYRCLDTGLTARRLTVDDITAIGGNADLAKASAFWRTGASPRTLPDHIQIVGTHQPTLQSLTVSDGVAKAHEYTCKSMPDKSIQRLDLAGDGTVYRESAQLPGLSAMPLAQSHGAIPRSEEALIAVTDALLYRETGPWLGGGDLGLRLPDMVRAGTPFELTVTGISHPRDAGCEIFDVESNMPIQSPRLFAADNVCAARIVLPSPGMYRVVVIGGGKSGVSQIVMASGED